MSKEEKFLLKIFSHPTPNNIKYDRMAKFLLSVGCIMKKRKGSSNRVFKHPEYPELMVLMEDEYVRPYQINQIRELLIFIGIVREE